MAALHALQTAAGSSRRNPMLFVLAAALGLVQLPGLVAQYLNPFIGGFVSLGMSGVLILVVPFFLGGLIGMANEALDGRASLDTFVAEGKSHYLSILLVYLGIVALNFAFGIVVGIAAIAGGAFFFASGGQPSLVVVAVVAVVGLLVLFGYLVVVFVIQFFGHAIVVDDLQAVAGVKRSAWCVRHNLLSVFGYTVIVVVAGSVFGLFGGLFSLVTAPSFRSGRMGPSAVGAAPDPTPLPLEVPEFGLVGVVGLALLYVLLSGLFGGLFAAYSTAFYREIRPTP